MRTFDVQTPEDLAHALDTLISNNSLQLEIMNGTFSPPLVFNGLNQTIKYNNPSGLESLCGDSCALMSRICEMRVPDVKIVTVCSGSQENVFHHYNLVKLPNNGIYILDLSAAQFFTAPITAFHGKPYFLGKRENLKHIVDTSLSRTWKKIQDSMSDLELTDLGHLDRLVREKQDIKIRLGKFFSKASSTKENTNTGSYLKTEYLDTGWESTWGNKSRFLYSSHCTTQDNTLWDNNFTVACP